MTTPPAHVEAFKRFYNRFPDGSIERVCPMSHNWNVRLWKYGETWEHCGYKSVVEVVDSVFAQADFYKWNVNESEVEHG